MGLRLLVQSGHTGHLSWSDTVDFSNAMVSGIDGSPTQASTIESSMLHNSTSQRSGMVWLIACHSQDLQRKMEKCSLSVRSNHFWSCCTLYHCFTEPHRVLMRPRKLLKLDEDVCTKLAMALITRYSPLNGPKISMSIAKKYIPTGPVVQWGRVQVAECGDRMCCREMIKPGSLGRDCTYVRVRVSVTITLCSTA